MGCVYALGALGYVFIWNAMAIINFAQGANGEPKWVTTVKF